MLFIHEHFEELEASFQREYALDLGRLLYGARARGIRRIHALVSQLSGVETAASTYKPSAAEALSQIIGRPRPGRRSRGDISYVPKVGVSDAL